MLIIPEVHTIFILPPRTGSSTLHNAVRIAFPAAFMLYRHAERDAIPPGYETFAVKGFVRHPLTRMWSLFKFLCTLDPMGSASWAQEEVMQMLEAVQGKTFEQWLLTNDKPLPLNLSGYPGLYQKRPVAATVKSCWDYLRPDMGTQIFQFADLPNLMEEWGLPALHENRTTKAHGLPPMTKHIQRHLETHMSWELELGLEIC